MLDQTAKLQPIISVGQESTGEIRLNGNWRSKAFQQLVVEVVAVSQAEAAAAVLRR